MSNSENEQEEQIARVVASSQRMVTRFLAVGFIAFIVLAIILAAIAYFTYDHVTGDGDPGEPVEFIVPEGATGNDVAGLLAEADLIGHPVLFRLALRWDPSDEPIKHGIHLLPLGASPSALLRQLREPAPQPEDTFAFRVTVPEGLTIAQIAALFTGVEDAFLAALEDFDPMENLEIDAPSLEGFLMPNTYYFPEEPVMHEVVARMLAQFRDDYAALLAEFPEQADQDPVRIVTIASLIEEEARVDDERPIISAVIHNRLKYDRALEMDSTLQYALGKYGQRLLNEDKQVDSPYNTYKRRGLPPGPISNPGVASIRAAMNPADVEYLYFVSNADGMTHTFSRTLKEHQQAVAKYRRDIRIQRRQERLDQAEQ